MKYCFNCGAELMDNNQSFCIECGTDLKKRYEKHSNYKKEYRKKFNKLDGESYTDYLNRIDSPLKDSPIASEEEIELESMSYINYNPNEKKEEIIYPEDEEELESNWINDELKSLIEDPYKKEVISEGMFGKPAVSIQGNFVYEGMYGRPKYYIDGDIIRENNQFGKPAYRIDGKYMREGMFGKPKYYIDGDLIRENNQFGKVVGRRKK